MTMHQGEASVHGGAGMAAAGGRGGLDAAAAFDQFGQGLYTYCLSRLSVPAEAGEAVRDTFVIALCKASGLAEPHRLRAWLFAVARSECDRRLRSGPASAPLYESAQAMDDTAQLSAITKQGELRALVRAALAELDPAEREICELNLRHGLAGADLGAVLGVPRAQAQALASRACARFERSLGVLLIARAGPDYCPDLAGILEGSGGRPAVLLRRQVRQHTARCAVCSELKRRDLAPAMLLSMLTVPALPAGLRPRIAALVSGTAPDAAACRAEVMGRAAPFGPDGFPVQPATPAVPRRKSVAVLAAALAVAALALLGGGTYYVDYTSTHPGPAPGTPSPSAPATTAPATRPATTPARTRSSSAPAAVPSTAPAVIAPVTHPATPTHKATPTHTATPTHSATPTPTPTRTPTRTPTPTPTPTRSPAPTPTPSSLLSVVPTP